VKIKSALITEASGSIGGLTASHNRGGYYFRARVVPTNPGSSYQTAVRAIMADLAVRWTSLLSDAERAAWDIYADLVPIPDTLGEPRNVGGLGMYVRTNVPRIQAGLARIDAAPTHYSLASIQNVTVGTFAVATQDFQVTFNNSDKWATESGGALFILASRPANAARNYFKGPYRYADKVEGDDVTPPTSPATVSAPFAFAVGQVVHVQIRAQYADGRLSLPFRSSGVGA
jgi:hypothetical protein